MHTSKLKNIYNKTGANADCKNYKKQKNFCINLLRNTKKDYFQKLNISYLTYLLRNTKKDYFQKLNISYLTYNKKFWKIIKPFFRNKGLNSNIYTDTKREKYLNFWWETFNHLEEKIFCKYNDKRLRFQMRQWKSYWYPNHCEWYTWKT